MFRAQPGSAHEIPTLANAAIMIAQLLAIFGCFYAAAHVQQWWTVTLLAIGFGVLMNSVYSIIHEAEHAMLFPNRAANEAAGVIMALFFPAPFHLIRQGHIGHHMRNRSDDEAFDLYFDGDNIVWRWLVWLGILTGLYYVLVVIANVIAVFAPFILDRRHFKIDRHMSVDRASAAFLESFNPLYMRWIRLEGLAVIVMHTLIVWGLHIPIWHYVALYASFGFMWSAMQYVHHYGTERHVTRGAKPVDFRPHRCDLAESQLAPGASQHPTVPWVHLPRIGQEEAPQPRRGFLPWAYMKMWRGPRRTDEHVENKYAGRIIQ